MKRILLAALLPIFFVSAVGGQGTSGNQDRGEIEKKILEVEQQRDQAIQDRDMNVLDRIHADDFTFVNTRGGLLTKAQYLEAIRTGAIKFLSFKQDDYHFQIYGNTVVVTGRSSGVVEYYGKVNQVPRRFTLVYVSDHGRWQLVTYHGTVIVEQ